MSLELDLQIALDMPGLPDASELRRWAEAALSGAHHAGDAEVNIAHRQRGRKHRAQ